MSDASMNEAKAKQVIQANIDVHAKVAAHYAKTEPHFRPENVALVEKRLRALCDATSAKSLLDLGCGTGFMIAIAKKLVPRVVGVDVTRAMLDQVDTTLPSDGSGGRATKIELVEHDTGTYEPEVGAFDVVTAYSFLHHLYDVEPTMKTAAKALRKGGKFYADLEPNFYFWDAITQLEKTANEARPTKPSYDPIVAREIDAVGHKDEEIAAQFGIDPEVFNDAEYGKTQTGGFKEETIKEQLARAGFADVEIRYYWFLGQAFLVNEEGLDRSVRLANAEKTDQVLQRVMPLSRQLYKYVGFVATK